MSTRRFHAEKYTLPVAAVLTVREQWRPSVSRSDDPVFSFTRSRDAGDARHSADAFDVRRDFLSIRSPEDALYFFARYGPFQFKPNNTSATKESLAVRAEPIAWSWLMQTQQDFAECLLAEGIPVKKAWLYEFVFARPLSLDVPFRAVSPQPSKRQDPPRLTDSLEDAAIAPCADVVDALRASVFLSRMRGFQWSRCARRGCEQLFEQTTRRRKLYCTPECAHLQAVNDYNARRKTAPGTENHKKGR
jgi:hypothetical protein